MPLDQTKAQVAKFRIVRIFLTSGIFQQLPQDMSIILNAYLTFFSNAAWWPPFYFNNASTMWSFNLFTASSFHFG